MSGNTVVLAFQMQRCTSGDCGTSCSGGGNSVNDRSGDRRAPPSGDLTTLVSRITDFYINHKEYEANDPTHRKPTLSLSRDVRLYYQYTGATPKQYHASESQDFVGATWQNVPPQDSTGDPFVNYTLISGGPARRTVYFQLRSTETARIMSLNSNVADDRVDLDPSANTMGRKRYSLKRGDFDSLVTYAVSSGFDFTGEKVGTDGLFCEVLPSLLLSAEAFETRALSFSTYSKVTCSFDLFKGRKLNPGWKLISVDTKLEHPGPCNPQASLFVASPYFLWTKLPSGTEDAHVTLMYFHMGGPQHPDCKKSGVFVTEIVLEGPEGSDWHDAFRQD
ncbi:MAG: hypothetical protein H0W99_07705 [Acidobacteria bacterium]|nr:hypothetical protein [Acidobacteriota bacterium]